MPEWFTSAVEKAIEKIAKRVHSGELKTNTDAELLALVGGLLASTVSENVGANFATVDYDTPDAAMLARLTRDVWHFSVAKNYQQLRDLTLALRDEQGKLREFAAYKTEVEKINEKFNGTWLRTEWNTAVGSSQMAARWLDFQENETSPFLMYDTAGDKRVRKDHDALDGIIRRITDEFWRTHYPPNGYGCRCDVRQLAGEDIAETTDLPAVNIPEMFRTNLAENGLVYPKGHAYFDGVPAPELERALLYLPNDSVYNTVSVDVGATLEMHILHGVQEMADNITIGKQLIKAGHNVELLPIITHLGGKERRKLLGKDLVSDTKTPDARIDGQLFEFKTSKSTENAIQTAIRGAKKQANSIAIRLRDTLPDDTIKRYVKGRWARETTVKEIWILTAENKLLKLKKEDVGL